MYLIALTNQNFGGERELVYCMTQIKIECRRCRQSMFIKRFLFCEAESIFLSFIVSIKLENTPEILFNLFIYRFKLILYNIMLSMKYTEQEVNIQ